MKPFSRSLLLALSAFAGTAHGQVPSTNDTSDVNGNTGMGSGALAVAPAAAGGFYNTASGFHALGVNTANDNTAAGFRALNDNTTGYSNSAVGSNALYSNSSGNSNAAFGFYALPANTTGNNNTALGTYTLQTNRTGINNTASGFMALNANDSGNANSAYGYYALAVNSTGINNTASGAYALQANTTGNANTASGYQALNKNRSGVQNTATGENALFGNSTGKFNTAVGYGALNKNTSGQYNVSLGWEAGFALTTGSNNIDIDNQGEAGDNGTIRIGTEGTQTNTAIAGIFNNTSVSGLPVVVDSTGQLGAQAPSAERFKTAIAAMGSSSAKLQQLRPVTFHYKADPQGTLRYGLVAEEVAKVYPELVVRDNKGRLYGVRYDELAPMLLNEVQTQQQTIAAQAMRISELEQQQKQFATQVELKDLKQQLHAAMAALQAKDHLVAQR